MVVNGSVDSIDLCEDCFKKGYAAPILQELNKEPPVSIKKEKTIKEQILAAMKKAFGGVFSEEQEVVEQLDGEKRCPECNISAAEMTKQGKIGCSHCYDHFHDELKSIIKRLQDGESQHTGKVPNNSISVEKQIKALTDAMNAAAILEDYEKAAKLRDQIKELETQEEVNG